MISALNRLANGTVELTITIPQKSIKLGYQKALTHLATNAEIKGFRKGKAPLPMVEKTLGKQAVSEHLLKDIIPDFYLRAVQEHNLKPILNPQVQVISLADDKDWQIKALTCEMPEVNLGKYQEAVAQGNAPDKIWVPGKDKKPVETPANDEAKIAKLFQTLLKSCQVIVPEILIQEEVNRMLSRLIDQTGRLGLTVDQYLNSTGKNLDNIKKEYHAQAEESLKLELVLNAIANQEKIEVSDADVEKMIAAAPDKETQNKLNTPEQKAYIKQLLRKRQIIDKLSRL